MRLHLKSWKALGNSFGFPVVFLGGGMLFRFFNQDLSVIDLLPIVLVALVCSTAFFLASVQRELVHHSTLFLLPAFKNGIKFNQVLVGAIVGLLVFLTIFFVPQIFSQTTSSLVNAWSASSIAVGLYSLVLLATLGFSYAHYLPNLGIFIGFISFRNLMEVSDKTVVAVLDNGLLITAGCAAVVFVIFRILSQKSFLRYLLVKPYMSASDIYNPVKIEEFKQEMVQGKTSRNEGQRPLGFILSNIAEWVGRYRVDGKIARAIVLQGVYCFLATTVPRSKIRFILFVSVLPLGALILGIAGFGQHTDGELNNWFPSLLFQGCYLSALVFFYIRNNPLGRLASRRSRERAGYLCAAFSVMVGLFGNGLIWMLFEFYQAVLNGQVVAGHILNIEMPNIYVIFLPLMVVPVVLVVTILRANQRATLASEQAGMFGFFLYMGLVVLAPLKVALGVIAGVSLLFWIVFPVLWRRLVRRMDLA